MATYELHPVSVEPTDRNVELLRSLGTLALAASPLALAAAVAGSASAALAGLLGFAYCLGWLCSLAGLYLTGAMGRGRVERRVLAVQSVLVAVAAAWSIGEPALAGAGDSGLPFVPGDAAWPLAHHGLLLVGGNVLRAGTWRGWARVTPLLCGLALPIAHLAGAGGGDGAAFVAFGLATTGSFALQAWAVRTSGARLR
jgi:hypothetical protein